MNTKVDEGKLISKKQAATAFIDGEDVEFMDQTGQWRTILDNTVLKVFLDRAQFRLKPRTITINGIEAPSIKKESAIYRSNDTVAIVCESFEEAELMCLALRQVFGGSHDN